MRPVADAEDFHGPVLFSGDASADVMNRLFVPNVEANCGRRWGRLQGRRGRTGRAIKARVLPEMLDVVDDPLETDVCGEIAGGGVRRG